MRPAAAAVLGGGIAAVTFSLIADGFIWIAHVTSTPPACVTHAFGQYVGPAASWCSTRWQWEACGWIDGAILIAVLTLAAVVVVRRSR